MKTCTKCKIEKQHTDYYKQQKSRDGLSWSCKQCHKLYQEKRREEPEFLLKKRENSFRFSYGITLEEYDTMNDAQGHVCAICSLPESKNHSRSGKILPLSVDHCHQTNKVRGLLCSQCNLMLGLANDNIEKLLSAVSYLSGGEN